MCLFLFISQALWTRAHITYTANLSQFVFCYCFLPGQGLCKITGSAHSDYMAHTVYLVSLWSPLATSCWLGVHVQDKPCSMTVLFHFPFKQEFTFPLHNGTCVILITISITCLLCIHVLSVFSYVFILAFNSKQILCFIV